MRLDHLLSTSFARSEHALKCCIQAKNEGQAAFFLLGGGIVLSVCAPKYDEATGNVVEGQSDVGDLTETKPRSRNARCRTVDFSLRGGGFVEN